MKNAPRFSTRRGSDLVNSPHVCNLRDKLYNTRSFSDPWPLAEYVQSTSCRKHIFFSNGLLTSSVFLCNVSCHVSVLPIHYLSAFIVIFRYNLKLWKSSFHTFATIHRAYPTELLLPSTVFLLESFFSPLSLLSTPSPIIRIKSSRSSRDIRRMQMFFATSCFHPVVFRTVVSISYVTVGIISATDTFHFS